VSNVCVCVCVPQGGDAIANGGSLGMLMPPMSDIGGGLGTGATRSQHELRGGQHALMPMASDAMAAAQVRTRALDIRKRALDMSRSALEHPCKVRKRALDHRYKKMSPRSPLLEPDSGR